MEEWFYIVKLDAHPQIGMSVRDGSGGLKKIRPRENFYEDSGALRERIDHIQIAAVQAQLADPRGQFGARSNFDNLGSGDEGISRRATPLMSQGFGALNH